MFCLARNECPIITSVIIIVVFQKFDDNIYVLCNSSTPLRSFCFWGSNKIIIAVVILIIAKVGRIVWHRALCDYGWPSDILTVLSRWHSGSRKRLTFVLPQYIDDGLTDGHWWQRLGMVGPSTQWRSPRRRWRNDSTSGTLTSRRTRPRRKTRVRRRLMVYRTLVTHLHGRLLSSKTVLYKMRRKKVPTMSTRKVDRILTVGCHRTAATTWPFVAFWGQTKRDVNYGGWWIVEFQGGVDAPATVFWQPSWLNKCPASPQRSRQPLSCLWSLTIKIQVKCHLLDFLDCVAVWFKLQNIFQFRLSLFFSVSFPFFVIFSFLLTESKFFR